MQSNLLRSIACVAALAGGALLVPHTALAQMGMPGNNPGTAGLLQNPAPPAAKKSAPPPALPGAESRTGSPAPPSDVPMDMSPNEALFDAINRGDVAAARDALSRGAQLDAHNLLGMTPMELAVDLGRNDIAFLLLSMRGSGTGSAPPPAASAERSAAKAPASPPPPRGRRVVVAKESTPVVAPASPVRPRLFAHDGGTPIPSIGFLGFDPPRGTP